MAKVSEKAKVPPHAHVPYTGTTRTAKAMFLMADGDRGARNLGFRRVIENIVRDVKPRDYLSQLAAIYNWFNARWQYLKDPVPSEMVSDPVRIMDDIAEKGRFLGDCDDAATFLVGAARTIGIKAIPIRVGFAKGRKVRVKKNGRVRRVRLPTPYTHVLAVARDQHGRIVALDPVAGIRTWSMLRRTKRYG